MYVNLELVMSIDEALEKFKTEICNRSKEVDPESERDWYCMSYGFFLALGLSIEDAEDAACKARYDHQYWC